MEPSQAYLAYLQYQIAPTFPSPGAESEGDGKTEASTTPATSSSNPAAPTSAAAPITPSSPTPLRTSKVASSFLSVESPIRALNFDDELSAPVPVAPADPGFALGRRKPGRTRELGSRFASASSASANSTDGAAGISFVSPIGPHTALTPQKRKHPSRIIHARTSQSRTPQYRELGFIPRKGAPGFFDVKILGKTFCVQKLDSSDSKLGKFQSIFKFVIDAQSKESHQIIINKELLDVRKLLLKTPKAFAEYELETKKGASDRYNSGMRTESTYLHDVCGQIFTGITHTRNAIEEFPDLNIRMPKYYINPKTVVNANGEIDAKGEHYASYSLVQLMKSPVSTAGWSKDNKDKTIDEIFRHSAKDKKALETMKKVLVKSAEETEKRGSEVLGDFRPRNLMWDDEDEINDVDPDEREDSDVNLAGYIRDCAAGNRNVFNWIMQEIVGKFPTTQSSIMRRFAEWEIANGGKFPDSEGPNNESLDLSSSSAASRTEERTPSPETAATASSEGTVSPVTPPCTPPTASRRL